MELDALEQAGALTRERDGALLLQVHVQPGARSSGAAGLHGERLKVRLAAPPVDGKANKELVAWAAGWLAVPKAAVTLIRGHKGRQKTLRIER